jgi:hypothetical protein
MMLNCGSMAATATHNSGIVFASVEGAVASGAGDKTVMPNQHVRDENSHYQAAAAGYLRPSDNLLINVGGVPQRQGRVLQTPLLLP